MSEAPDHQKPIYGKTQRRVSRNLILMLYGLMGFAGLAFALLYAFGRNFGVGV